MGDLVVVLLVGLGTYLTRALFLVTARAETPGVLRQLLPYVAPAVLAAITVPALLAPHGSVSPTETLPGIAAAVVSWLLWHRTRQLPVALLGGFAFWWVLAAVVG
ncbi:MAG TPA: AzlD domain-containing protein [Nocardioidaceae bacterium]